MMPFASECCKCSKLLVGLFWEPYRNGIRHNLILKNRTIAIIDISVVISVVQSWTIIYSQQGWTMMPFAPECCKFSKLVVGLFRQPYRNGTRRNSILKTLNYCYYSFLRIYQYCTIVDNNQQLAKVHNDAICTRMLQMLQITSGLVTGAVQKCYKAQLNFKKLNHCYYSYFRSSQCCTIMHHNQQLVRVCNDAFAPECCKCSKLLVGLFREPYRNGTRHN